MAESQTGTKFGHPTFNCNVCSSFAQRTSQSCFNHSQEPCEWVNADLWVLWVESEQILHLKVGLSEVQLFTLHVQIFIQCYLVNVKIKYAT